jgi:GNAT superfamily N-acetyltransferase
MVEIGESELPDLLDLYQGAYWASERTEAEARAILKNSDILFGTRDLDTGRMVAFARVLTDRATIALLCDVIVHPAHRGKGLGKEMMERVASHPLLRGVRIIQLNCRHDVLAFYERWGFEELDPEIRTMRRIRREQNDKNGRPEGQE